jgi:hypothetical protein
MRIQSARPLTFKQLGKPRINYHSQPSARYGYSNLALFGSIVSTLSMPRLPAWSCPNVIAVMNVEWKNRSQDPIEKRFEDLTASMSFPISEARNRQIIPCTWALRKKRRPDSSLIKYKSPALPSR